MPLVLFLFLLLLQLKQSVALLFPFLLTSLFPLQLILLLLKFKRLLRFRAYSIFALVRSSSSISTLTSI